jgi:hypothetical protein
MNNYNHQITSREFKLMLKPDMFVDRDETVENIIQIIGAQSEELGCTFKKGDKFPEEVKTMYRDTKAHQLNRVYNFFLRIRKKSDEYDITLKCRHPDRYMAASYDLRHPVGNSNLKFKEYKFEEDITTPVLAKPSHRSTFHSKFSSQAKFESKNKPELDRFQVIRSLYPDLKVRISPEERLFKVNEFEATEVSWSLGHIIVPEGDEIKSEMSMWYSSDKDKTPMIVELDFDCKAIKVSEKTSLEQFPFPMVESINHLYTSLQEENIVDLSMLKTKTEFAYEMSGG